MSALHCFDFILTDPTICSVSAVAAHAGPVNAEAVSSNPADAQSMGYARSKWVAENLVALAAQTRGIRAESLRIGQMVGDTVHGVWNETEAISLQLKGAQTIKAMPDLDEVSPIFKHEYLLDLTPQIYCRPFLGFRSIWLQNPLSK